MIKIKSTKHKHDKINRDDKKKINENDKVNGDDKNKVNKDDKKNKRNTLLKPLK